MARSRIALDGLPHSEIPGSKPVCGSPGLIAAYHVLHRRPAPRHPPYALSSLTTTFTLLETRVVGYRCLQLNQDLRLSMSRGLLARSGFSSGDATDRPSPGGMIDRWRLPSRSAGGGADRSRTGGLRLARAALSQLSYSPESEVHGGPKWI
jgi:hypothetical protein